MLHHCGCAPAARWSGSGRINWSSHRPEDSRADAARAHREQPFSAGSSKKKHKDAAETALVAAFARLCTVEASRNEQKPRSLFDLSTDEPRLSSDLFASCVLGEFDGGLPKVWRK